MGAARRLYLYAASAISLGVVGLGVFNLLAVLLGEIADSLGARILTDGGSASREQISLAIALVVVGLPVWLIHWWLAERGLRGTDQHAMNDQRSAIRAFHFGFVQLVALSVGIYAAISLVAWLFGLVLGADDQGRRLTDDVAILLVAAPIWLYHGWLRNAGLRRARLDGAAAWLTRLYRYGGAFVGLIAFLLGASQAIGTVLTVLVGRSDFGAVDDWWQGVLASSLATIVVGLAIWWLHWRDASQAIRDTDAIGEDDRDTALRATYFGAVVLVTVANVSVFVAGSIAELGRWLLGTADGSGLVAFLESMVGPPLAVLPFAVAGWLHVRYWRREAAGRGRAALASAERLTLHLVGLVGITFLAIGAAQLLGLLLERLIGPGGDDEFFRRQLPWFIAQMLVGAALWLPAWSAILRRRATTPDAESRAISSRAYLYLVVGAALITGVPSAAFVLYRFIDTLLGGGGSRLAPDVATPLAVVLVVGLVAAYHGRVLLDDLRRAPESAKPGEGTAPARTTAATSLDLVLRGPDDADLDAIVKALRAQLPPGVSLEGASTPRTVAAPGLVPGEAAMGRVDESP